MVVKIPGNSIVYIGAIHKKVCPKFKTPIEAVKRKTGSKLIASSIRFGKDKKGFGTKVKVCYIAVIMFTSIITFLQAIATALEPLSAPLVSWINANLPEDEALHQMKRCKAYCRHNHLLSQEEILTQVEVCFKDESADMQEKITQNLFVELNPKK